MSHTIAYKQVVVRYPRDALNNLLPEQNFWFDQFILLELSGANNCTTYHPRSGREVGARDWSVLAVGDSFEIMRGAVRSSAFCEGGDLRFYGEHNTLPETYIRRVRNTMKKPYSAQEMRNMAFSLTVRIDEKLLGEDNPPRIALLNQHATCGQTEDGQRHWCLQPLISNKDAALLFLLRLPLSSWRFTAIEGPVFEHEAPEIFMPNNRQSSLLECDHL